MLPDSPIYNGLLWAYRRTSGVGRMFVRGALEAWVRGWTILGDPAVRTEIRGRKLSMPISHRLPLVDATCPLYDALLPRLSRFLRPRHGGFHMIDVGANIGDTITACAEHPDDRFLAVEVNQRFLRYLRTNCSGIAHLSVVEALCSESEGEAEVTIDQHHGTSVVSSESRGRAIRKRTLDSIAEVEGTGLPITFVKTDTDGYDFQVLRGAERTIRRCRPAVLFEGDSFQNPRYVEDVVETFERFASAGYQRAALYDNLGYLFDVVNLRQPERFTNALLYQMNRRVPYFDVLVMTEADLVPFLQAERELFASLVPEAVLRPTAAVAAAFK